MLSTSITVPSFCKRSSVISQRYAREAILKQKKEFATRSSAVACSWTRGPAGGPASGANRFATVCARLLQCAYTVGYPPLAQPKRNRKPTPALRARAPAGRGGAMRAAAPRLRAREEEPSAMVISGPPPVVGPTARRRRPKMLEVRHRHPLDARARLLERLVAPLPQKSLLETSSTPERPGRGPATQRSRAEKKNRVEDEDEDEDDDDDDLLLLGGRGVLGTFGPVDPRRLENHRFSAHNHYPELAACAIRVDLGPWRAKQRELARLEKDPARLLEPRCGAVADNLQAHLDLAARVLDPAARVLDPHESPTTAATAPQGFPTCAADLQGSAPASPSCALAEMRRRQQELGDDPMDVDEDDCSRDAVDAAAAATAAALVERMLRTDAKVEARQTHSSPRASNGAAKARVSLVPVPCDDHVMTHAPDDAPMPDRPVAPNSDLHIASGDHPMRAGTPEPSTSCASVPCAPSAPDLGDDMIQNVAPSAPSLLVDADQESAASRQQAAAVETVVAEKLASESSGSSPVSKGHEQDVRPQQAKLDQASPMAQSGPEIIVIDDSDEDDEDPGEGKREHDSETRSEESAACRAAVSRKRKMGRASEEIDAEEDGADPIKEEEGASGNDGRQPGGAHAKHRKVLMQDSSEPPNACAADAARKLASEDNASQHGPREASMAQGPDEEAALALRAFKTLRPASASTVSLASAATMLTAKYSVAAHPKDCDVSSVNNETEAYVASEEEAKRDDDKEKQPSQVNTSDAQQAKDCESKIEGPAEDHDEEDGEEEEAEEEEEEEEKETEHEGRAESQAQGDETIEVETCAALEEAARLREQQDMEKEDLRSQVGALRQTVHSLKRAVDNAHGEKTQLAHMSAASVKTREARIVQLEAERESAVAETDALRRALEGLRENLRATEQQRSEAEQQAQHLLAVAAQEKDGRSKLETIARTMSSQLTGAENEAFRLQSQLQDETNRRAQLERESAQVRALVRVATDQSKHWESHVSGVLDRFDRQVQALEGRRARVEAVLEKQRAARLAEMQRTKELTARIEILKTQARPRCLVCMHAPIAVCYVPCGHRSVCPSCDTRIRVCPVCRASIRERVRTFDAGV